MLHFQVWPAEVSVDRIRWGQMCGQTKKRHLSVMVFSCIKPKRDPCYCGAVDTLPIHCNITGPLGVKRKYSSSVTFWQTNIKGATCEAMLSSSFLMTSVFGGWQLTAKVRTISPLWISTHCIVKRSANCLADLFQFLFSSTQEIQQSISYLGDHFKGKITAHRFHTWFSRQQRVENFSPLSFVGS